ncbi:serine/threonine protein kinase [Minicystis rosea]|nr:serine/threonine protein kinase [Minicystis rosea]
MSGVTELYAGRCMGAYELIFPLAQGATASVWAARMKSSALEKIVAVKAMLTEFSFEYDTESMFLDEARLVSRIRHPNVAAVLDLGEEDDALYIVMEWVEGEPLQVLMREAKSQRIPLQLAVRIAKQAASGLHAAHELTDEAGEPVNLVHRDVSPQNILVGFDGSVKVIDFGVAKAASNMQRTNVGQIKGKVPYMAPEQAVGDPVDRRTDIFALGVVLYQLVTGRHPFRGDNEFATLARLRDPRPVDPPGKWTSVPAELEQVMLKALAKNREHRFATMLDFARALERALPSSPDEERILGELVRSLLTPRAVKRSREILEALRALGHTRRPVNLSQTFDEEQARGTISATLAAFATVAPPPLSSTPPPPSVKPAAKPEKTEPAAPTTSAAPVQTPVDVPLVIPDLIAGDRQRNRVKRIAAGITIALMLVLGLWAVLGDHPPPDGSTSTTKRAF